MDVPCSYGIVDRRTRDFIIVNADISDRMYTILDMTPSESQEDILKVKISISFEGIDLAMVLDDGLEDSLGDGPPYNIFRLTFTRKNNGSLVTSGYLAYTESGQAMDYVMEKRMYEKSKWFAKLVLYCDSLRNDLPKAIENVVEKSRFVNEKEAQEACAICCEEYQSDCMIGTLRCKHSYHEECIKKWLKRKKSSCPLCRGSAFLYQ
ncbi:putative transcription factor C2H2 family [Helianthus annuus]|uniref:RING-type E3 ubiquitin transferase n=1 Tax=Helianthus annuus TaxID=4232 RepID=A0A251UMB5_HELAN|nr:NEP1-interacting protein-like 1 [Helianthus annuus]KAF5804434.1 putative transcription factor C2H2 family [Helianthus annuus]KAJ0569067.1 putative transcription factor C2H2 family [Helianthus annuus]KAJ0575423.1 putative transcription factor C2H2 family [Helianthus annuus]KAJ0583346.1 putative transcription factor C2H2 family [Helianthus annuus]KAJ0746081.1 putative transcription factor C2H2 family [Helianthus annuus]